MAFTFRRATRDAIKLLISVAGGTGSGKTYSLLRLATGLAQGKPIAFIDTENGRGLHYADEFDYQYTNLDAPFSPMRYLEAINAAAALSPAVIITDSASHEHAGDGGLLDMHDDEVTRMAGSDDWSKRDKVNMAGWIMPKREHKRFMQRLLQVDAHLLFGFRAEPKVEMKREGGRLKIVPKESLVGYHGWIPIAEKMMPFEMTASFMTLADQPGVPRPIKLPASLAPAFPADKVIDEACGERCAAWALGTKAKKKATPADTANTKGKPRDVEDFKRLIAAADSPFKLREAGLEIKAASHLEDAELLTLRLAVKTQQAKLKEATQPLKST